MKKTKLINAAIRQLNLISCTFDNKKMLHTRIAFSPEEKFVMRKSHLTLILKTKQNKNSNNDITKTKTHSNNVDFKTKQKYLDNQF